MAVASGNRFKRGNECPICDGHPSKPQGKGVRCWGFRSENDLYVYCTREEFAGGLPFVSRASAYCHFMGGPCRCGVTHINGATPPSFYRTVEQVERELVALEERARDLSAWA